MGADLYRRAYIETLPEQVDYHDDPLAYFRDSYNDSLLLTRLGYSWWQDVVPLLDEDNRLGGEALVTFRDRCRDGMLDLMGCDSETGAYFREKRTRLLAFLGAAIEAGDVIECSL